MLKSLFSLFDRVVVFDTETTGLEFGRDEIIELGAVSVTAAGEADCLDTLIRLSPGKCLPPFIKKRLGFCK